MAYLNENSSRKSYCPNDITDTQNWEEVNAFVDDPNSQAHTQTQPFIPVSPEQLQTWIAQIEKEEGIKKTDSTSPTNINLEKRTRVEYNSRIKTIKAIAANENIRSGVKPGSYKKDFEQLALLVADSTPKFLQTATFMNLFLYSEADVYEYLTDQNCSLYDVALILRMRTCGLMMMLQKLVITIPDVGNLTKQ